MRTVFTENQSNFQHCSFNFRNGYFDNYYGKSLFLDGILVDIIMIDNIKIWYILSAQAMVYIYRMRNSNIPFVRGFHTHIPHLTPEFEQHLSWGVLP